jgi:hypothetical protein
MRRLRTNAEKTHAFCHACFFAAFGRKTDKLLGYDSDFSQRRAGRSRGFGPHRTSFKKMRGR